MPTPIQILFVEDSPDDADLLLGELRLAGFDPTWKRVQTEEDFLEQLKHLPDIILSDYSMPRFNGLRAAELLHASGLDIPFILISGTVGEDVAVEAMRHGATDYLLKDRITRLGSAVERALRETQERRERSRVEEKLKILHRRHALILNSVVEGIHGVNLEGKITFENVAAAKMFGSETNEMIGQSAHALMHHSRADGSPFPEEECRIMATLRDGIIRRVDDEVFWRKDGTSFPVEYVVSPKRDEQGRISGVVVVFEDITERKRLAESHTQLALAVEQAIETIVITDTHANIIYVNPAFEHTSGYTRAEALGKNPRFLQSGKHDAKFYRQMWDVLGHGEVWHGHMINRHKNGKLYQEEATISPLRDSVGKVINFVAVKRDVTREVQLESQFRQSQKMEAIGQLAGGVAHDFNNLLAVIQMQAELLKFEGNLSEEQENYANEIVGTVKRAASLTRQLLLFGRKEILQMRQLDLNESITSLTKMLTRILGENIEVRLKLAAQSMLIHADAGMLDQVLMNLVVNARDAMPNGGHVIIGTAGVEFDELTATQVTQARPGAYVCLSVSDSGCGIPPEVLPKIFEPFFTTKDIGKGTGLGLATVFGIVQQHKGWINVRSEMDQGTTFEIYLPQLTENPEVEMLHGSRGAAQTGHETILLVEDEESLRTSIRGILTRLGYHVLQASTGVEALEVWKEHRAEIRLLLADLMMPGGMTGSQLSQLLLLQNPKLKVVYMSGYSPETVCKDLSLQQGVNFITKPFEAQKLAQVLRVAFGDPVSGSESKRPPSVRRHD